MVFYSQPVVVQHIAASSLRYHRRTRQATAFGALPSSTSFVSVTSSGDEVPRDYATSQMRRWKRIQLNRGPDYRHSVLCYTIAHMGTRYRRGHLQRPGRRGWEGQGRLQKARVLRGTSEKQRPRAFLGGYLLHRQIRPNRSPEIYQLHVSLVS